MQVSSRLAVVCLAVAVLAVACGGAGGVSLSDRDATPADDVLSSCDPAGDQETITLVEQSGELPPLATMEDAVGDNPDAEFMVEQLEAEGRSREDVLHAMYAQVVGQRLFDDARRLPGFVTGSYARPLEGEPFQLSFSGAVPEELDPDAYDLGSFGLEVTVGAAGLDHEAMAAAYEAATQVGMQPTSGSGDEVTGTARIEVLDATAEQVAAWEQVVDDPSRWCLVLAPRTLPCDESVIAAAGERAVRQGDVLANEQDEGEPTAERAEEVRRSYLGLTLEDARDKAAQEDRTVRVVAQDGVQLGQTDDLDPGRLSLTVCDDIVVDTRMDLEPAG